MKVIAEHGNYKLAQYENGERRIENKERNECSDWLTQGEQMQIEAHPPVMATWNCDNVLGVNAYGWEDDL